MRVINARRTVMELILSDHPKDCLSCAKSGNCDLQDMAVKLGIREIPGQEYAEMSTYRLDTSPSIIRELDKCIMCRRCETMCNEVQTCGILSGIDRGFCLNVLKSISSQAITTASAITTTPVNRKTMSAGPRFSFCGSVTSDTSSRHRPCHTLPKPPAVGG